MLVESIKLDENKNPDIIGRSVRQVYKGIHQKAGASFASSSPNELIFRYPPNYPTMKCFVAITLLALFAVAFAAEAPAKTEEVESPPAAEAPEAALRDKRGLLAGIAPVQYAAYQYSPYQYAAAPVAYSSYSLPYAYRSYPSYYSSYYLA
ncbi:uncharacterized protein LOC143430656 [Xylocopa sonorina]|uniref:uncharacterized protein LOC143430656 n=1 Tax=Xylocopa sonorina TaxID=1818115 RepID=UPI00403AD567